MQNGAKVFVPPRNKNARGYFMGVYYDISQTTGRPLEGQAVIPEEARSSLPHWNR